MECGQTYAQVLAGARQNINLADLGIANLKFRVAQTGGRVLEMAGSGGAEKADLLADRLRATFADRGVKIARPVKKAEIRLIGLDDFITRNDIVLKVASLVVETVGHGGPSTEFHVGEIKRSPTGSGSVLVECPVAVANKMVTAGRLTIGWSSVRVLEARPLQCFWCLEKGHVRHRCTAEVDRSNVCYRCGQPGHKAAGCSAKPCCPVCKDQDKPAEHWCGGPACKADPRRPRKKKIGEVIPKPATSGEMRESPLSEQPAIVAEDRDEHANGKGDGGAWVEVDRDRPATRESGGADPPPLTSKSRGRTRWTLQSNVHRVLLANLNHSARAQDMSHPGGVEYRDGCGDQAVCRLGQCLLAR